MEYAIIPLAQKPDFAQVCAAWSYGEWGCQVDTRNLKDVLERYEADAGHQSLPLTYLAISEANKPMGMVRLKEIDHIEREELKPWLSSLYVHPRYRGEGVAQALCEYVHRIAKDQYGYDRIHLFTGLAQDFYEKLGYERIGTVEDRSGFFTEGEALMMKML